MRPSGLHRQRFDGIVCLGIESCIDGAVRIQSCDAVAEHSCTATGVELLKFATDDNPAISLHRDSMYRTVCARIEGQRQMCRPH